MAKRIFDFTIALFFLTIAAPLLLVIAALLKLDSKGPALYTSQRVGKGGALFGLIRFRTVVIHKSEDLNMNERLSRVGRFIRRYSFDDFPNLINVLKGDLSMIGPRPTEPERVDPADPVWQKILTVKPGIFSPAILKLASSYNRSSPTLKNEIELSYVENASMRYDLQLFMQAINAFILSRGNVKARGKPESHIV